MDLGRPRRRTKAAVDWTSARVSCPLPRAAGSGSGPRRAVAGRERWAPPRRRFSTWLCDDHPSRMHDWTMPLAPRKEKKLQVEWLTGAAWARCATPRARAPACTEALPMSCNAARACAMSSDSTTHLRCAAARCCFVWRVCAASVRRVCGVCVCGGGGRVRGQGRRRKGAWAGQAEVAHSTAATTLPPVVLSPTRVLAPSCASCGAGCGRE